MSIKVRDSSYHFDRGHSPYAYRLIDEYLSRQSPTDADFCLEEHESGPELLVYLGGVTAGITLAKSVVDLIATIIEAKSEGVRKGDPPSAPLELIVRRIEKGHERSEEMILRIGHTDDVSNNVLEQQIEDALRRLLNQGSEGGH